MLPQMITAILMTPILAAPLPLFEERGWCSGTDYCEFLVILGEDGYLGAAGNFEGTIDVYGFSLSSFQGSHYRCEGRAGLVLCIFSPETAYRAPTLTGIIIVEAYARAAGSWRATISTLELG